MTKQDLVLRHLEAHGSITKLKAAELFHVYGLGEIIRRLRMKGYKIETRMIERPKKQSFARYTYKWK